MCVKDGGGNVVKASNVSELQKLCNKIHYKLLCAYAILKLDLNTMMTVKSNYVTVQTNVSLQKFYKYLPRRTKARRAHLYCLNTRTSSRTLQPRINALLNKCNMILQLFFMLDCSML